MKTLFFILISSSFCFSQKSDDNYIIYNNYASEAEFYFHEGNYDTAIYYFELGFERVSQPHPQHHYKYAKALWKVNAQKKAIKEVRGNRGISAIDTNWFTGLTKKEYKSINEAMIKNSFENEEKQFYQNFIDSIMILDQVVRNGFDINDTLKLNAIITQDSLNASALIQFTEKHGFPAGKNAGWSQDATVILLHMSPDWFIQNYNLLIQQVIIGNLEPWMLARGIDRRFTLEVNDVKICPYNRYWTESAINPFLMFQNCISLGVSPYYDFNWSSNPKKTIHFDYYRTNKKYYNTSVMIR